MFQQRRLWGQTRFNPRFNPGDLIPETRNLDIVSFSVSAAYHSRMVATVYIESSVISYLVARPSRDVVIAARQAITVEWWQSRRMDW
jgi:hypothetical protein